VAQAEQQHLQLQQQQQLQRQVQIRREEQEEQLQLEWQQQQDQAKARQQLQQQEQWQLQQQLQVSAEAASGQQRSQGTATETPGLFARLWGSVSRSVGSHKPQPQQPLNAQLEDPALLQQAWHEQQPLRLLQPVEQPLGHAPPPQQPRPLANQALQPEKADWSSNRQVQEAVAHLKVQQQRLRQLEQDLLRNESQRQHQERIEAARAAGTSEYQPVHEHCTPRCSYTCETPKCDEECHQVCESPTCQTRCKDVDLSGCRMNCGKPHCAVICPKETCMEEECPQCQTKCSEPMCMLQCPKAQPCHNECEQPRCQWKCKAPTSCPKPVCQMQCETHPKCVGDTFKELPPLQEGETAVQSFAAPANGPSALPAHEAVHRGMPQTMQVPVASLTSAAASTGAAWPGGEQLVDIPVLVTPSVA
jgi:hypothetical protein